MPDSETHLLLLGKRPRLLMSFSCHVCKCWDSVTSCEHWKWLWFSISRGNNKLTCCYMWKFSPVPNASLIKFLDHPNSVTMVQVSILWCPHFMAAAAGSIICLAASSWLHGTKRLSSQAQGDTVTIWWPPVGTSYLPRTLKHQWPVRKESWRVPLYSHRHGGNRASFQVEDRGSNSLWIPLLRMVLALAFGLPDFA